jgi:hypothetical protein
VLRQDLGWNEDIIGPQRVVELRAAKLSPAVGRDEQDPGGRHGALRIMLAPDEVAKSFGVRRGGAASLFGPRPLAMIAVVAMMMMETRTLAHGAILQKAASDDSFGQE